MKISKQQFLEMVDLAIAARGFDAVYTEGSSQHSIEYTESLDKAINEYVYWNYESSGKAAVGGTGHFKKLKTILSPWVHDND